MTFFMRRADKSISEIMLVRYGRQ